MIVCALYDFFMVVNLLTAGEMPDEYIFMKGFLFSRTIGF